MTNMKVNKLIRELANEIVPNIIDKIIRAIEDKEFSNNENSTCDHKSVCIDELWKKNCSFY